MFFLKQKDFAVSKSRDPDTDYTTVSILQVSLWVLGGWDFFFSYTF